MGFTFVFSIIMVILLIVGTLSSMCIGSGQKHNKEPKTNYMAIVATLVALAGFSLVLVLESTGTVATPDLLGKTGTLLLLVLSLAAIGACLYCYVKSRAQLRYFLMLWCNAWVGIAGMMRLAMQAV